MRRRHWFGEEVRRIDTTLDGLAMLLPTFERYGLGANRFQDVIARRDASGALPVAAVSKRYVLVQHATALDAVAGEIAEMGIEAASVPATLHISEYGTRIAVRAVLPREYAFEDTAGHKSALTFELFNSVDGTVPLMATVGWFRFVCSNGLVVGTAAASIRKRHSGGLDSEKVAIALRVGTALALRERGVVQALQKTPIAADRFASWIDGPLCEAWGPFAAARVHGIVTTGADGEPQQRPRRLAPHERRLLNPSSVPGAILDLNAYAVVQALSWVASRRANIHERLQWRADIKELTNTLLGIPPYRTEGTPASPSEDDPADGHAKNRRHALAHDVLS